MTQIYCSPLLFSVSNKVVFFIPAPGSVRSLRVLNSVSTSLCEIMISWSKPDGGDEIKQYYIKWYKHGRYQLGGYKYVEHISKTINYSYTVTNLQFETQYKLFVVPTNSAGTGFYQSTVITTGTYYSVRILRPANK